MSVRRPEASVASGTASRPDGTGRVDLEGARGCVLLAVVVFLDESSTGCQKSVNDKPTVDHIDIPGMGSPATTVNRAATGKRQVNFILSTEDQAVTIDSCKSRQYKQASQDLASNERTALKMNEELEDRTESKQSINRSHILTTSVQVTHPPTHTHTQTHSHHFQQLARLAASQVSTHPCTCRTLLVAVDGRGTWQLA